MNFLDRIAPKTFLGKFSLQVGAKYVGIFMCCMSIICVLAFLGNIVYYTKCETCSHTVLHDVYSFCINIVVYCICMLFVNLWFIWAVAHDKPPVVLAWVVVTTMWWLQGSSLILILLLLNIGNIGISWIVSFCFAIIGWAVFGYCILIGYAYWQEIRIRLASTTAQAPAAES